MQLGDWYLYLNNWLKRSLHAMWEEGLNGRKLERYSSELYL